MRVLLLGAAGKLGQALAAAVPANVDLIARSREALDVADAAALNRELRKLSPDCIVNAAAYTDVNQAEREKDLAYRVNADAVRLLGQFAFERQIRVVHFSTDHVFAGSDGAPYAEWAPCEPVNTYGESKLAGERALADSKCDALVVRAQWLFGPSGRSFASAMLERARRGVATRVVADQRGRPTYTRDLAAAVWLLISRGDRGPVHVANDGSATWYDLAVEVFAREGKADLVSPCTTAEYPTAARRPSDSRLDTQRAEMLLGYKLPSWRVAIGRFLGECDGPAAADETGPEPINPSPQRGPIG